MSHSVQLPHYTGVASNACDLEALQLNIFINGSLDVLGGDQCGDMVDLEVKDLTEV